MTMMIGVEVVNVNAVEVEPIQCVPV